MAIAYISDNIIRNKPEILELIRRRVKDLVIIKSLDFGIFTKDTLIDNYLPTRLDTSGLLYASPQMNWGDYWVRVENTGMQNDSARDHHLIIDAIRVIADVPVIKERIK